MAEIVLLVLAAMARMRQHARRCPAGSSSSPSPACSRSTSSGLPRCSPRRAATTCRSRRRPRAAGDRAAATRSCPNTRSRRPRPDRHAGRRRRRGHRRRRGRRCSSAGSRGAAPRARARRLGLHGRLPARARRPARRAAGDDALGLVRRARARFTRASPSSPTRSSSRDGNVWTSAGVTAGMDLALALVEEDLGRERALQVARQLVLFLRRPGGQAQFSAGLRRRPPSARRCASCRRGSPTTSTRTCRVGRSPQRAP